MFWVVIHIDCLYVHPHTHTHTHTPHTHTHTHTHGLQLIARITKHGWFDGDKKVFVFRDILDEAGTFLRVSCQLLAHFITCCIHVGANHLHSKINFTFLFMVNLHIMMCQLKAPPPLPLGLSGPLCSGCADPSHVGGGDEPGGVHEITHKPSQGGLLFQRWVSLRYLHSLVHTAKTDQCPRQDTGVIL